ncbi:MAG TPA: hypothetical protein PKA63_13875 [Oligoflexia bacterium]|nr:hypothetical protein [Oligoflexia bacterium]HMP49752.1 hypothetical protein [Oligoflexia bacterium]
MSFDEKTIQYLDYYVYALIDPDNGKPFYVGKGKGNRVFNHVNCALNDPTNSDKYDVIREIQERGDRVSHIILRHGLSEGVAFEIESTLIDFSIFFGHKLTNTVLGHNSIENGVMTTDEVIRKYNAPKLERLREDAIIININKSYKRGSGSDGIYLATKEAWVIDKRKLPTIKFVLSEFRGIIVEVFEVGRWYPVNTTKNDGKIKVRYGFEGVIAQEEVKREYHHTSVAHIKGQGNANPIRYKLQKRSSEA